MLKIRVLKKIIFGLLIISSLSVNLKADDMDPFSAAEIIMYGVGSAAGTLVGYAGVESYNILTQDTNTRVTNTRVTNTMDRDTTTTDDRD